MTGCEDRLLQLHALLDGELDAVNSVAIEAHLKSCVGCAEAFARLEAVHAQISDPALQLQAPASLRARLEEVGLGVEAMNSPAACRTYNVLLAEGRRVAVALLPV